MSGRVQQASFAGKRNGPVESYLVGLPAGLVVILPHLTGAVVLVPYNPVLDVYSPGKPAIYSRLARQVRPLE